MTKEKEITFDEAFDEATSEEHEEKLEANADTSLESTSETDPSNEEEANQVEEETSDSEEEATEEDTDAEGTSEEQVDEPVEDDEQSELERLKALYEFERKKREEAEQKHRMTEGRLIAATRNQSGTTRDKPEEEQELSVEESKALAEFRQEFPEFVDPIEELVKKQIKAAAKKFETNIHQQIDPLKTYLETSETQSHFEKIASAHPDWEYIVNGGDLDKWQAALPAHAQAGVDFIRQQGNAQQVIEMLNQYKADRKMSKKQPTKRAPAERPTTPKKSNETDELLSQLKAALAVSSSKTRTPTDRTEPDPDDFDKAFEEAVRELS